MALQRAVISEVVETDLFRLVNTYTPLKKNRALDSRTVAKVYFTAGLERHAIGKCVTFSLIACWQTWLSRQLRKLRAK